MSASATPRGSRVVLLERDERVRAVLRALLGEAGFDVSVVQDWASAREALWAPCAMVVIDVDSPQLPEMYRLLRELGARGSLPPVVIVSDSHDSEDVLAGVRLGVRDWLRRPLRPGEVLNLVRRHLRRPTKVLNGLKAPKALPGAAIEGAPSLADVMAAGDDEQAVRVPPVAAAPGPVAQ